MLRPIGPIAAGIVEKLSAGVDVAGSCKVEALARKHPAKSNNARLNREGLRPAGVQLAAPGAHGGMRATPQRDGVGSRGGIRTRDFLVMSQASCPDCSTLRRIFLPVSHNGLPMLSTKKCVAFASTLFPCSGKDLLSPLVRGSFLLSGVLCPIKVFSRVWSSIIQAAARAFAIFAIALTVTPSKPRRFAALSTSFHHSGGMKSRWPHLLTVFALAPMSSASSEGRRQRERISR